MFKVALFVGPPNEDKFDKRLGSPEDAAFAGVLSSVMHGERSLAQALQAYAAICRHRAQELRTVAAGTPPSVPFPSTLVVAAFEFCTALCYTQLLALLLLLHLMKSAFGCAASFAPCSRRANM